MKLTRDQSIKVVMQRLLVPHNSGVESMERIVGKGNAEDIDLYEVLGNLGVSEEEVDKAVKGL